MFLHIVKNERIVELPAEGQTLPIDRGVCCFAQSRCYRNLLSKTVESPRSAASPERQSRHLHIH